MLAAQVSIVQILLRESYEDFGNEETLPELDERYAKEIQTEQEQYKQSLFASVGRSLTTWAVLEEIVVFIFSILNHGDRKKAGVILYSIVNFRTWLSIISDLFVYDELYASVRPRWNKLSSRLRALKDVRDRIAHQSALSPTEFVDIVSLTALKPSPFDIRSKSLKYSPLTTDQIDEFYHRVKEVLYDLETLHDDMVKINSKHLEKMEEEFSRQYDAERAADRH